MKENLDIYKEMNEEFETTPEGFFKKPPQYAHNVEKHMMNTYHLGIQKGRASEQKLRNKIANEMGKNRETDQALLRILDTSLTSQEGKGERLRHPSNRTRFR
jgi:hypothetical protein